MLTIDFVESTLQATATMPTHSKETTHFSSILMYPGIVQSHRCGAVEELQRLGKADRHAVRSITYQ